jgi:hypothetical protein
MNPNRLKSRRGGTTDEKLLSVAPALPQARVVSIRWEKLLCL